MNRRLFVFLASIALLTIFSLDKAQVVMVQAQAPKDAISGTWTTTTPLPQAFGHAPAVVYNGRIYIAGGEGTSGTIRTTVYYATIQADGSVSAWNTTTALALPIHYHAMVAANDYLYIIGPIGGPGGSNVIHRAFIKPDGTLGNWLPLPLTPLPVRLTSPMAVVAGSRLYVLGGYNGTTNQDTVYYTTINADGTLASWNTTTSLPQKLSFGGAVVANGRIYIAGGWLGTGWTTATYSAVINADGTLGSWNALSVLPKAVGNHVLLRGGNALYLAGGLDNTSSQKAVYSAALNTDGTLGNWVAMPDLPQPLHDHTGVFYGSLYILGGFNSTTGAYQSTVYMNQLPFSCATQTDIPTSECEALVAFYNSTNGSQWTDHSGWLTTNTPCQWVYVTCFNGHVETLDPDHNNLSGSLPAEIGNLNQLDWLSVSNNQLSGRLPATIGNLTGISHLYLDHNSFNGALPDSLRNLATLDTFQFNNTNLCEPADTPFQTWLASIPNLQRTNVPCTTPLFSISGRVTNGAYFEKQVVVDAHTEWFNTDVTVQSGDQVQIKYLSGTWTIWKGVDPYTDANGQTGRKDPCTFLPSANTSGLVGRVGTGNVQFVGNMKSFTAQSSASLFLSINDCTGQYQNNDGTLTLLVSVISGANTPIEGVTISAGAGQPAHTDTNGNYTLPGLTAGTYTLTPSKSGYIFSPPLLSVTVPPNATEQNFTGTASSTTIASVNPVPPYCVVRTDNDVYQRLLEIAGTGLADPSISIQFRRMDNHNTSSLIRAEATWESDVRVTLDMDRVKHLLWSDSRLDLQLRFMHWENGTYVPVSEWSSSFTLADNVATCGIRRNRPPVVTDQTVTTAQNTPKSIMLTASDADGDPLTYTFTNPVNGQLSGTAPNLTYTPNAGFSGSDSFTFKATDGKADSNIATVTITVIPQTDTYTCGQFHITPIPLFVPCSGTPPVLELGFSGFPPPITLTNGAYYRVANPQFVALSEERCWGSYGCTTTGLLINVDSEPFDNWTEINACDASCSGGTDTVSPASVTDLAAIPDLINPGGVRLSWIAPGDDGTGGGTATQYDIRYSSTPINDSNWTSATQVNNEPTPVSPGSTQLMFISGLSTGTRRYFAMRTADEAGNISAISNVPSLQDSDFRPSLDGYQFRNNFSAVDSDYTIYDMRKMFGDNVVCQIGGAICNFKPQAEEWRKAMISKIDSGHCLGMSVTSLRFFTNLDSPSTFQSDARTVHDLTLYNARQNITYYHVEQWVGPVEQRIREALQRSLSDTVNQLYLQMSGPGTDLPTLVLLRNASEGHAVTPFAVADNGSGVHTVWIYDNNSPDITNKTVEINIDPKTIPNVWRYNFRNENQPEWWTGTDQDDWLGIVPNSLFVTTFQGFVYPFAPDATSNQMWLGGQSHLLITDSQGRRIGYIGDQLINEIPGAFTSTFIGGAGVPNEPLYTIPLNEQYTILLDGQTLTLPETVGFTQFGPGYAVSVKDVILTSTSRDQLKIVMDGTQLAYRASDTKSVTLALALDNTGESYQFQFDGVDIGAGQEVKTIVDIAEGSLALINADASSGTYDLDIERVGTLGVQTFNYANMTVSSGDTHYIDYGIWSGFSPMTLQIDHNSDGTIDQTLMLDNQAPRLYLPLVVR